MNCRTHRRTDVMELHPDPAAVRSARAFVRDHCRVAAVAAHDCDMVVLMTSELVTNAVLHGRSLARLSITTSDGAARTRSDSNAETADAEVQVLAIRVEVSDDNSRHPIAPATDHEALDGRGIAIVDLLATAWGVRDEPIGKTVWFELTTTGTATGRGGAAG